MAPAGKPISSPVPDAWYPTLSFILLAVGLVITASFFILHQNSGTSCAFMLKYGKVCVKNAKTYWNSSATCTSRVLLFHKVMKLLPPGKIAVLQRK